MGVCSKPICMFEGDMGTGAGAETLHRAAEGYEGLCTWTAVDKLLV